MSRVVLPGLADGGQQSGAGVAVQVFLEELG